jgi:hypothetical protein
MTSEELKYYGLGKALADTVQKAGRNFWDRKNGGIVAVIEMPSITETILLLNVIDNAMPEKKG